MRAAFIGGKTIGGALDGEDRIDPRHGLDGDRSLLQIGQLEELATGMRPAGRLADWARLATRFVQPAEPREGVRLYDAVEVAEPGLGMRAGAVWGVEVGRGRRLGSTEGAVVAHHRPDPARAGLPLG